MDGDEVTMANKSNSGSLADSFFDAMSIGNIFLKIVQFFVFGLITATPYLIFNLDHVAMNARETGTSGIFLLIAYMQALFGAMWKGMFLGLSTLFNTFLHISTVISEFKIGTMIFSLVVLVFATLTVFQPIRLTFNILDMRKGRDHSRIFVFFISLIVTALVVSPISWLVAGGETITSGVDEDGNSKLNSPVNETTNQTQTQQDPAESIIAAINMLEGDTS